MKPYLPLSLLLNAILLWFLLRSCGAATPCAEIVSMKHDTLITYRAPLDTSLRMVKHTLPKPVKRIATTLAVPYTGGSGVFTNDCSYSVLYADTLYQKAQYRAVINDTISQNHIIGRSIFFADLHPIQVEHIEHTQSLMKKPPLIQLSIGLTIAAGQNRTDSKLYFDVGPALLLNVKSKYQITYNYQPIHNIHQLGGYFKVW